MQRTMRALLVGGLLLGFTHSAVAQSALTRPWEDRVFGGINFGVQAASSDVEENSTFVVYDEDGRLSTRSGFGSSPLFDVSLGVRAWRNFGVALGFTSTSTSDDGELQADIPHPIFFDRLRSVSANVGGLDRREQAYHVMFGWMVPTGDKMDIFVHVGPSFYRLRQDVIVLTAANVSEVGEPFTEVNVTHSVESRGKSMTGFNIGADLSYFMWSNDRYRLGFGGFIRYAGASGDLRLANAESSVGVGGAQFGFGFRGRF